MSDVHAEIEKLRDAIESLEAQRATLGDSVVESALSALRSQLARLQTGVAYETPPDERKIVTVVFADVSGFTALSDSLDPEEVRHMINACFDRLVPAVQKYEGTIDKFIGDEIMAVFGAPVAHEDDAERALRAALEMMEAIADFNRAHGTKLGLHMGINTGRVVAGGVGGRDRRDYSVMGDAVNLAARLEDASETGEIFVGASTYRATAGLFDFEVMAPLQLKGKETPVEVYRLVRAKTARFRARGIEGLQAPLTGRDAELAAMGRAMDELSAGRGSVVTVLGEAGLGKSRLLAEARALVANRATWAEGRSLSFTTGQSYWLARDLIFNLLGLGSDAASAVIAEKLRDELAESCGGAAADLFPYLARMLELSLTDEMTERMKFLTGKALHARMLESFRNYIQARARRRPIILVCEDLHWTDPSSLQMLQEVALLVRSEPLLLICTSRLEEKTVSKPVARLEESAGNHALRLELKPLSADESTDLMQALLRIRDLPVHVRELVVKRAEGNPFYLEELLRSLIDAGAVVLETEGPRLVREVAAIDIPDTLQEVLGARIDRLEREQKLVLQKASVIGRTFDRVVLKALHDGNGNADLELNKALEELERRQFVRSRRNHGAPSDPEMSGGEFIFKHAITHDVAYESLLVATRKELHAATARALEKIFPERLDDLAPVLGFHFERGEIVEPAARYLTQAAERARANFANEEAITYYRSALRAQEAVLRENETLENRRMAAHLAESAGDLLTLTGRQEEARESLASALSTLGEDNHIGRGRLHRKIGFSHSMQRNYSASEEGFSEGDRDLDRMEAERSADWWEEKLQIQLERMHLFYWQGMVTEMRQLADCYGSDIEKRGTATQRSRYLKTIALSLLMGSAFHPSAECEDAARRAVEAIANLPDLAELGHVHFVLGLVLLWRGKFDEALENCATGLQMTEKVGDLIVQSRCLTYLALGNRRRGNVELAREWAGRALQLATRLQMVEYIALAKGNLSWVAWKEGKLDDAMQLGTEAIEQWHGMDDPLSIDWIALWPLIAAAFDRGETARAVELARGLFADGQHALDAEVMAVTKQAIDTAQMGETEATRRGMEGALRVAKTHHYL